MDEIKPSSISFSFNVGNTNRLLLTLDTGLMPDKAKELMKSFYQGKNGLYLHLLERIDSWKL